MTHPHCLHATLLDHTMLVDFEVQRCTRTCAASGRKLEPGETFFSVLEADGAEFRRIDYASEAWQGPVEASLGWWKSRVPEKRHKKPKLAPNDVLLELFDRLADDPANADTRFVLTLLLVRRRVVREEEQTASDRSELTVYCPRREETYVVPETIPDEQRIREIQTYLSELLYADAA